MKIELDNGKDIAKANNKGEEFKDGNIVPYTKPMESSKPLMSAAAIKDALRREVMDEAKRLAEIAVL